MSSPGTSFTPVPGLCLLFEREAFGHSALSGCSFFGSWFDSAWLVVFGGVELKFSQDFAGFGVDDQDVQVFDDHADACSRVF